MGMMSVNEALREIKEITEKIDTLETEKERINERIYSLQKEAESLKFLTTAHLKECVVGNYYIVMDKTVTDNYDVSVATITDGKPGYPYAITYKDKTVGGCSSNDKKYIEQRYYQLRKLAFKSGLDRFITKIEKPAFIREPENDNKNTFDMIKMYVNICNDWPERKNYIKHNIKEIMRIVTGNLSENKTFQKYNVPIFSFEIFLGFKRVTLSSIIT